MPNGSYLEMSFIGELQTKAIAVVGAGVTGTATANYLIGLGITPVVFDESEKLIAGIKSEQLLDQKIDLAIVSPGWKRTHPILQDMEKSGTVLMSEIDFAWKVKQEIAPSQKWIALSGTNGKTTTIQMVESIFHASKIRGTACGNVGRTVIEAISGPESFDFLALELSSFQIEWSNEARYAACAMLNIAEDHIDWHGSFDSYANSKMRLLNFSDIAILNADDVEVSNRSSSWNGKKVFYSLETPSPGELGLVEELLVDRAFVPNVEHAEVLAELVDISPAVPHNVSNALAAAGLARAIGISHEDIKRGLASFEVDHHRLEKILEKDGITWMNDSKATNPHAAIASILSQEKVVWIAGGLAKGASMEELVSRAAPRLQAAILIGTDRALIKSALAEYAPQVAVVEIDANSSPEELMNEVVTASVKFARPGDVVLLAPACASMDQFNSYSHRGDLFTASVHEIVGTP